MIENALDNLINFVEREDFKGYDPYDYLNSWIPFRWFGKWGQAIPIQIGKLNPLNIRPLMGVKKEENPKGLGLLLQAYCNLYESKREFKYLEKAKYLFERLLVLRSANHEHYCWGYNFVWANPAQVHPKYLPSVVVSSFVGQGIYKYYLITKDKQAEEVLKSIAGYILNDLKCTKTDDGICFSYTEEKADCCYNASILGAEMLAIVYSMTKEAYLKEKIEKAVSFILAHQKEDGMWNYSIDLKSGKESHQIDFHQGFVLCALAKTAKYAELDNPLINKAIIKGLEYYRKEQFFDNGVSLWRVPKQYPVEIHNQAQGIITFSLLSQYDESYLSFAKTIAEWTINNMQDKKGYFYYRKFKRYTNKIPYMRWSQAWMMLGLSQLMLNYSNKCYFK